MAVILTPNNSSSGYRKNGLLFTLLDPLMDYCEGFEQCGGHQEVNGRNWRNETSLS